MTSSRSKASISNWFASIFLAIAVLGVWSSVVEARGRKRAVEAGGRKRVVVLEFEGAKAEKFHDDLTKLLKKTHTVVPIDKWNATAEELDASKLDAKDLMKVAKKLKVDVIIQGKIEKRRDEYLVKIKVRAGKSGELVGEGVDTKADGPRLDGKASKDIKDELFDVIDGLGSNRDAGDEEAEEDKPSVKKKPGKKDEEDEETKPGIKKKPGKKDEEADEAAEDKPVVKKAEPKKVEPKTAEPRDKEEDSPLPKVITKRPPKPRHEDGEQVATKADDEDDEGGSVERRSGDAPTSAMALTPGYRAVDVVAGLSFNARRLRFSYDSDLVNKPPGYKGVPVAGLLIDATVFPLAIGHEGTGLLKNLGLTAMYDKVLVINSKSMGMTLPTSEARYAFGAVFRYPFGSGGMVAASLRYGRQNFTITGMVDVPNFNYTIIDPSLMLRYPITQKIVLGANFGFMGILGTGAIQKNDEYGAASVSGFEGEIGGDYMLTKNLFGRAAFKFEAISFTFKGTGAKSTNRDTDAEQDVQGANDNYYGGAITVGYLY